MNPDPKQLLQIIHNRGEQAAVPARIHDEAREAARMLNDWITQQLTPHPPEQPVQEKK